MGEPARKPSHEPEILDDDEVVHLQRWIERPDGSFELLERPLTPEDFLNPQLEDKMTQGRAHVETTDYLFGIVKGHFASQPDVAVSMDLKHVFGPGLYAPSPDVSVVRGVSDPDLMEDSYNFRVIGVLPCLLIEVISPKNRRIRRVDEEDKLRFYQQVGIEEYFLVLPPRRKKLGQRFGLWGYRLGPNRRYRPIEPDENGRLFSSTTGLQFAVSPEGDRIDVFNAATGERYPASDEEKKRLKAAEAAQKAAEEKASQEAAARRAAEEELERLRAEIQRLKPER
ncbi:MAG TPA: Uma2 family endonuclease [Thermoanaerobaculia bacterium]|jgi:Uma2 family endonuclease|nr:Uma2 family endonuclease [Thermoanaerobaculia bacterium]